MSRERKVKVSFEVLDQMIRQRLKSDMAPSAFVVTVDFDEHKNMDIAIYDPCEGRFLYYDLTMHDLLSEIEYGAYQVTEANAHRSGSRRWLSLKLRLPLPKHLKRSFDKAFLPIVKVSDSGSEKITEVNLRLPMLVFMAFLLFHTC